MIRAACLLLIAVFAAGCAEVTLATAGTLAGMAAAGISTGSDVYHMGKLDSADMASYAQWIHDVHLAAADLGLTMEKQEEYADGKWRCTVADDRKTRMRVYIERRSSELCWTRIDVGVFGSETTARLLLARIRRHNTPALRATTTTAPTVAS